MSMLDLADRMANAQEPEVVPSGNEHQLEVIKCKTGESDKEGPTLSYVTYQLKITDPPEGILNPRMIDLFFWTASFEDISEAYGADMANSNDLRWKYFLEGIGIDYTQPFHFEDDIVGQTGFAVLGEKDEGEYGKKNTVKKWIGRK